MTAQDDARRLLEEGVVASHTGGLLDPNVFLAGVTVVGRDRLGICSSEQLQAYLINRTDEGSVVLLRNPSGASRARVMLEPE